MWKPASGIYLNFPHVDSEDTEQTGPMPMLIGVFTERKPILLSFQDPAHKMHHNKPTNKEEMTFQRCLDDLNYENWAISHENLLLTYTNICNNLDADEPSHLPIVW